MTYGAKYVKYGTKYVKYGAKCVKYGAKYVKYETKPLTILMQSGWPFISYTESRKKYEA